jgi:hypothetical protein
MTVFVYVNTSKQVGDPEHIKVFAPAIRNAPEPPVTGDFPDWGLSRNLRRIGLPAAPRVSGCRKR